MPRRTSSAMEPMILLVMGGLVMAMVLAILLPAIGAWYHRRTGIDGLGLGDAKLFGAAGAWLGWQMLPHVLLAASLAGLVAAGLLRRRRIAFGPWIAAGFFAVWLWRTYLP